MKFSTRVNKSYESRLIYDQLEEDNPAVYLLFGLCNYIALKDTLKQGLQILEDLKKGVIHEIPNYNVKEVTKIENYIRTGKFKYDMMQLAKNKEKILDLLKEFFDDIMETTTEDLNSKVEALLLKLIETIKKIDVAIQEADHNIFENSFAEFMNQYDWTEVKLKYQADKRQCRVTMDWLQEKQEEELQKLLLLDVMCNVKKPSNQKLGSVDYEYHKSLLPCDFEGFHNYQVAYTKFMTLFASRKEELIIPQLDEYGRYIALNFYNFRPEQQKALYGFVKKLQLIHKDMVIKKPELEKYLVGTNDEGVEGTRYFAVYIHLLKIFEQPWFNEFRSDKRYTLKWVEEFLDDLLRSEWRDEIADEWRNKSLIMKGCIIGCMKEAGIINGSDLSIASAIINGDEKDNKTFAIYMGKGKKKGFCTWICDYVRQ